MFPLIQPRNNTTDMTAGRRGVDNPSSTVHMSPGVTGESVPSTAVHMSPGVTGEGAPHTDAPPSYEDSLQHRTLEYQSTYYGPPTGYPGPPPTPPTGAPSHHARGAGAFSRPLHFLRRPGSALSRDTTVDTTDRDSVASGSGEGGPGEDCIRMTLPPMHMCMAVFCLVLNFLVPGLGTMTAGLGVFCCVRREDWTCSNRCASCCINLGIGLAQLLSTPVLLLGWVWSILWGFAFVGVSHEDYHGNKRTRRQPAAEVAGIPQPPPYTTTASGSAMPPPPLGPPPAQTTTPAGHCPTGDGPALPPPAAQISATHVADVHTPPGESRPTDQSENSTSPRGAPKPEEEFVVVQLERRHSQTHAQSTNSPSFDLSPRSAIADVSS